MQTVGLSAEDAIDIITTYSATNQQLPAVAATPGWFVIGAFKMPITWEVQLEAIGAVSVAGAELHLRLFDLTSNAPVGGTDVTITSTEDGRAESGVVELEGQRLYQIQAEVIGPAGFGTVKAAKLI